MKYLITIILFVALNLNLHADSPVSVMANRTNAAIRAPLEFFTSNVVGSASVTVTRLTGDNAGKIQLTATASGSGTVSNATTGLDITNGVVIITNQNLLNLAGGSGTAANTNNTTFVSNSIATKVVRKVFNVMNYGASGTGNDALDAPAFKVAFSNACYFGGIMYVPRGLYVDTNSYTVPVWASTGTHSAQGGSEICIEGDGKDASLVYVANTNATYLHCLGQIPGIKGIGFRNVGSGTNCCLVATNQPGVAGLISDARFDSFYKGADIAAHDGLRVMSGQFRDCYVGLRVSGYSDGVNVEMRADACRAGLVIGGLMPSYSYSKANGGRFHVEGNGNGYHVVVGRSGGNVISGYTEGNTNCVVAVGYPTGLLSDESYMETQTVPQLNIESLQDGTANANRDFIRLYVPCTELRVSGCYGGDLIHSMTASADANSGWLLTGNTHVDKQVVWSDGSTTDGDAGGTVTKTFSYRWNQLHESGVLTANHAGNADGLTNLNDGIYFVTDYGIAATNADNSDAFQKLLTNVFNAGGGTIKFPPGRFKFLSRIRFPNNGAWPPVQPAFRITGAGSHYSHYGSAPSGGTILDLQASNSFAKIDTRAFGNLELDHLTLLCTNISRTPFIKSLYTTLTIHQVGFYGSAQGTNANEDGIIFGGYTTNGSDYVGANTNDQANFQGYGTVVTDCFFQRIAAGARFNSSGNGIIFRANTFQNECGGHAAIVLEPLSGSCSGNVISENLFEMNSYTNGIYVNGASANFFVNNNFFDPPSWVGNAYHITNSSGIQIIGGWIDASLVKVYPDFGSGSGIHLPGFTGSTNKIGNITKFYARTEFGPTQPWFIGSDGAVFGWAINDNGPQLEFTPAGGTNSRLVRVIRGSTDTVSWHIGTPGKDATISTEGNLYLNSGGATKSIWLGHASTERHYVNNGVLFSTATGRRFANPNGALHVWSGTASASDTYQASFGFTNGAFHFFGQNNTAYTNVHTGVLTAHGGVKTETVDATNSITTLGSISASNILGNLSAVKLATNWFYSSTLGVTNLNFIGTLWTSATPGMYRITCAMVTTNFGAWGTNAFYIHPVTSFLGNTDSGDAAAWNGFTPAVVGECYSQSWTLMQDITNSITFQMVVGGDVASHNAAGTAYWAVEKIATF